jgi:hypothetical protein
MRMNSRVCDLLVMSIVCIYSALAIVDVVGTSLRERVLCVCVCVWCMNARALA